MNVSWVQPIDIVDLLIADAYRDEYILNDRTIRNSGFEHESLGELCDDIYRGNTPPHQENSYWNAQVPKIVKTVNIRKNLCDTSSVFDIEPETYSALPRFQLSTSDIAITIMGATPDILGRAWAYQTWVGKACFSDAVAAIKNITSRVDREYLATYLNSRFGHQSIMRWSGSSTREYITNTALKRVPIPVPDPKIQAYIGDKVRLAEKCREEAQAKRSQTEYLLDQHAQKADIAALMSAKPQPSHNIEAKIINDRLDAEFYQPHYLDLVQIIQASPHQKLGDVIQLPIKGVQPEYDSTGTVPALTGTDIDPYRLDLEGASRVNMEWARGKTKALAVSNEILFTVTGPPLGEAAVVHSFQAPLVINSHVARIKTRQSFPYPFYLAALMNSIIVSAQVYRYCKGVRQKELYPEDIMQFVIPEIDIEIVRQINSLGYAADFLEYRASGLIREAIADVENLIEGKLQTSEIIANKLIALTWEDIEHQVQDAHA